MRKGKSSFPANLPLSTRLAVTMVLVVAVTAGVTAFLNLRTVTNVTTNQTRARLKTENRLLASQLVSYVGNPMGDVLAARGEAALAGIIRARRGGGIDPETGLSEAAWRHQLADRFEADLRAMPPYLQFRYIGADGREIVRVDRSGPGGAIRTVPRAALQDKASRGYVVAALRTPPGTAYLSPLNLNREHGRIETPHVPVLRAATPVTVDHGMVAGVLVINVDMRPAFAQLRAGVNVGKQVFLVNAAGDYLVAPERAWEFGFDLGHPVRIQDRFPALAAMIPATGTTAGMVRAPDGTRTLAAVTRVSLGSGRIVSVVETLPFSFASTRAINRSSLEAGGGVAAVALILALALGHRLTRPLRQITAAVDDISAKRPYHLPTDAAGEIGALARTLKDYIERERFYGAVIESTDDAVLTKTLDGTITSWNRGAERLYGYRANEAIGQSIDLITLPEHRTEIHDILKRIAGGEYIEHFATRRITKSQRLVDVSLSISPLRDPSGKITGASAISRDITEHRRALERFHTVVEACPVGMIITGENGAMQIVNSATERMFGYRREELVGQSVEMLVPPAIRGSHPGLRAEFMAKPVSRPMGQGRDLHGLRKDGATLPVEVSLSPAEGPDGPMVICIVADITRRKAAERAIEAHRLELERSNADLEQFAYVASHDLREPLRMVASYTELLAERYKGQLDEKADRYIGYATEGAKRMQQMVSDLLSYSRVGRTNLAPKPVDTGAVVARILSLYRLYIQETGAELVCNGLPTIVTDEGQFTQVMQNLIGNALKFRGSARPHVEVAAMRDGDFWKFSVKDNGIGIDKQHSERIFQMFQRLHAWDKFEGSGIGLAITKKIVERHGGRIWLESVPGEGSTFFFSIPVAFSGGQT